jgi:TatD DNase family protein
MKEKKIATVTIGVDFETSQKSIELSEKNENIFASVGLHPEHSSRDSLDNSDTDIQLEKISKSASHRRVVCIGECGLDYFRMEGSF